MEGRVEMEVQQRFFRGLTLGQAGFCTSSSPMCVHTHSADTPGPKVQIEALPDFRIKHALLTVLFWSPCSSHFL